MAATCLAVLATTCLAVLWCIWDPVKEALLGCLGTSVTDIVSPLRERAVEGITSRTVLWGNRIQRLPRSTLSMVGREQLLSDIQGLLKGDKKGIIGLYGVGGVGKTTLLTEINNRLSESRDNSFDVVIWVTVSKDKTVFKIQEDIGVRFGFSRAGEGGSRKLPTDEHDRRRVLHQALFGKKFLLLLDDMWEAVDLRSVGVPHPSNGAKIVLTTRSRDVCVGMEAEAKVRVDCLNEKGSWELFCSKVGDEVDLNKGSVIRPLAESMVSKCGGVPRALINAARAMSGETSIPKWHDLFSVLKLSFDRLPDESTRQCLLYCSLFLADHCIGWNSQYLKGQETKESRASIHSRMPGGHGSVRLHDLVREMALWLTDKTYKATVLSVREMALWLTDKTYKATVLSVRLHDLVRECLFT